MRSTYQAAEEPGRWAVVGWLSVVVCAACRLLDAETERLGDPIIVRQNWLHPQSNRNQQ